MQRLTLDLKGHPLNDSIYADGADEKLIESVRANGILEPLIVDFKDRIVSGHRRWDAAKKVNLKNVPVELFQSQNELDIQTALVEANRQRVKTNEQQAREAAQLFKIEQAKARQRQANASRKAKVPAKSPEAGDARELAGAQLGVGGKKIMQQKVLDVVRENPQWNFLFLTKFPQRYLDFEFPDNAWVGTSVDRQNRVDVAEEIFKSVKATVKWLSCEPMLEDLTFKHLDRFQWVVMGGSSRSTQTPEFKPEREWINHLWAQAKDAGCMIYEKPNLLERCREYPMDTQ